MLPKVSIPCINTFTMLMFALVTDVKDRHTLVARKQDALKRFVDILHPIRSIYNLPPATLHIFTDTSGDLIAFNRNGSIFLNLRYYEAWRTYASLLIFAVLTH